MSRLTPVLRLSGVLMTLTFGMAAMAAPLIGSGANLAIPGPNPGAPNAVPQDLSNVTPGGFDGSWSPPAFAPWLGTYSAEGPVPSGQTGLTGLTRYDFSTMPTGHLPADSIFVFGDVDGGSFTNETFVLNAFDSTGALITTPWLNEPIGVTGIGTGPGQTILPNNMPGWSWNAGLGEYVIDGSTVTGGNPSISVWLDSNTAIASMNLVRTSDFANFNLWAPIPEPTSTGAVLLTILAAGMRRRSL
jgi:hypothetical protein